MTDMPLIANCLANRSTVYDWQGNSVSSEWKPKLTHSDLFKLNGNNLAEYIITHPVYWYYSQHWTPLYLKPDTTFWIEYTVNPENFSQDEIDLPVPYLGIYIHATRTEINNEYEYADQLEVYSFYGKTKNHLVVSPCHEIITLDSEGKVVEREIQGMDTEDSVLKYRTLRDDFFGVFALTVISSQVDGESVAVLPKNARLPLRNVNHKNKAKRDKAKKNAKMRYWDIVVG